MAPHQEPLLRVTFTGTLRENHKQGHFNNIHNVEPTRSKTELKNGATSIVKAASLYMRGAWKRSPKKHVNIVISKAKKRVSMIRVVGTLIESHDKEMNS